MALAQSEQARAEALSTRGVVSRQDLDVRRTKTQVAAAALTAAKANVEARQGVVEAEAAVRAEIAARIGDSTLVAPAAGRVLYRLAQPGEIVGSGGNLLTLASLENIYLEFFLSAADGSRKPARSCPATPTRPIRRSGSSCVARSTPPAIRFGSRRYPRCSTNCRC